MSELVGNPEDRFSVNEAQIVSKFECTQYQGFQYLGVSDLSGIYQFLFFLFYRLKMTSQIICLLMHVTLSKNCIGMQTSKKSFFPSDFSVLVVDDILLLTFIIGMAYLGAAYY